MPFEIGSMELASVLSLPDIAHHTAAIALTVDTEQQNGKRGDLRSLEVRRRRRVNFIEQRDNAPPSPRAVVSAGQERTPQTRTAPARVLESSVDDLPLR